MKQIILLLIAALCINAAFVERDDQQNDTQSTISIKTEDDFPITISSLPPIDHPKSETNEQIEINKSQNVHHTENKGEKQEERNHKKGENQEQNLQDKGESQNDRNNGDNNEKQGGKNDKQQKNQENDKERKNLSESKEQMSNNDDKSGNLRSPDLIQSESQKSNNQKGHSHWKKGGSKLRKQFKQLPKGARIAIISATSIIGMVIIFKLFKCCQNRRQQRKERRITMRQQHLQNQQSVNQSQNIGQPFLPTLQTIADVDQPTQNINYQYPPLTHTIVQQEQNSIPQLNNNNNHYQQPQQPYYIIPNKYVLQQKFTNSQNIMQVELPKFSINQESRSTSQQQVEVENSRRYPILPQQQINNGYQQI